ncbi:energy-coupling factor ABC transporter ATP-binding protein [Gephyromycinifex aptenodytis]|uniref:energy-coupling factor ABC transporter ATP-binding protein n=1 Tax=Gephyromycinifex aptenodytis TaxID=2716227 RepID=UPI0014482AB6|nr:ATP-binding cassette domain-containing protein [Gephyromycinifex aptenodytis]
MSHQSLRARDVHFSYGEAPVLRGAELDIAGGTRLALLGANGSGKTTLLRVLSGAVEPGQGEVLLDEKPIAYNRAGLRHHRQNVQLVLQDPDDQLFSADVRRDISFGPLNLGLSTAETSERVDEALELLAITDLADRPVHQLSYGQRKRAAIAGAVAMRPCLLLLDEPTAGLDPVGVQEVFAALRRLEERATTVVLATHDVDLALAWAHQCAVVEGGRVVQGDPVEVLDRADLLDRARLRRPWVLELAERLGIRADPDAAPLRDLDGFAARCMELGVSLPR